MKTDFIYINGNWKAVSFAMGCVLTSFKARAKDFDTRFTFGLWSIALITSAFAVYRIQCAWRGVTVIMGRPDPIYEALIHGSDADKMLAATYHSAAPIVISLFFGLGFIHLLTAYFLARRKLHHFVIAWCAGFLIASIAVTIQLSIIWSLRGIPSEFLGLIFQLLTLPTLLLWSEGRRNHSKNMYL